MADISLSGLLAAADTGLSGRDVRGAIAPGSPEYVADATSASLEETVRQAARFVLDGLDLGGQALEKAVDVASDKAFQSAANVGANIASPEMAQHTFSWSGYIQAVGVLCLLLAALWFAVWLIRRYGKFNFLPRPGALPKDALIMEAQMPLGPKKGLMVVRFLNRRLLLGVTEHQISLITEEKAQDERKDKEFQDLMDDARRAGNSSGNNGGPA